MVGARGPEQQGGDLHDACSAAQAMGASQRCYQPLASKLSTGIFGQ